MNKKILSAAALIHESLRIQSDCFLSDGKIRPVKYLVALDDDATSALTAVELYYKIRDQYGHCPIIICAGGKGLMSKYTHKGSEAELLAYVCNSLGVPEKNIIMCKFGKNSGDNVLAVFDEAKSEPVIFVATQRLSLRLQLTQRKQAAAMQAYYYVIEESLENACKLYNGKALLGNRMMYHELASILYRCKEYEGTFQIPMSEIGLEIGEDVESAASVLEKYYRLKLPMTKWQMLRMLPQFIGLWISLKLWGRFMKESLEEAIKKQADALFEADLANGKDLSGYDMRRFRGYRKSGLDQWNGCYGLSAQYGEPSDPVFTEEKMTFGYHSNKPIEGFVPAPELEKMILYA